MAAHALLNEKNVIVGIYENKKLALKNANEAHRTTGHPYSVVLYKEADAKEVNAEFKSARK